MPRKQKTEEKYQGREFTTTLQANTEVELNRMIRSLRSYARRMGIDDYEVLQKRRDPDGGWEATIKAHNWNGFNWLKDKFSSFKESMAKRAEERREKTLTNLRVERASEDAEREKIDADLSERRRIKAEKEARKEEIAVAKRQAEEAKREREEAKRELRREKFAVVFKAGEAVSRALKPKGREIPIRETARERRIREGREGKVIEGEEYFWKAGSQSRGELVGSARSLRGEGFTTKIIKRNGNYDLFVRMKPESISRRGNFPRITPARPRLVR